jgi:hypothetical protein
MFFRAALLIAGAGLAVAQSISSECTSTLLTVASNAPCLDLTLLAPIVLSNSNTTSIIPTVNTWLTGMCSQGPCTNATIQAVVTNITTGCASDLAGLGLPTNDTSSVVAAAEEGYPSFREISCLKDTAANSLCVTELLTDIQSSTSTLSLSNIFSLLTLYLSGSGSSISLPQNVTCSNCSKAAYTIVSKNLPSLVSSDQAALQAECGSSFTNGQMPSGIQTTSSNSSSGSTGGAASFSANGLNVGVAMLVAVSLAFATFA